MLKTRIIPIMLWDEFGLVKGVGFNPNRRVGSVMPALRVYNARDVDELVLLDISASKNGSGPRFSNISEFSKECSVPFTVGGGVSNLAQIEALLRCGADKIMLNSSTYRNIELVENAAKSFGSQCVVVGIDYKVIDGVPVCFSNCGTVRQPIELLEWVKLVELAGAGEILLTCIDRDGTLNGMDHHTISQVTLSTEIPVIAAGGARDYSDILEAIVNSKASAVAAGSIFQFTEQTPNQLRENLAAQGVPVRHSLRLKP